MTEGSGWRSFFPGFSDCYVTHEVAYVSAKGSVFGISLATLHNCVGSEHQGFKIHLFRLHALSIVQPQVFASFRQLCNGVRTVVCVELIRGGRRNYPQEPLINTFVDVQGWAQWRRGHKKEIQIACVFNKYYILQYKSTGYLLLAKKIILHFSCPTSGTILKHRQSLLFKDSGRLPKSSWWGCLNFYLCLSSLSFGTSGVWYVPITCYFNGGGK